ncbi:MAG TPA: AAA family ATPase, partial [Alphaproteobacteria bacterium]|nr:AAA family ATPase [Alphaproteobacteria bacterium]
LNNIDSIFELGDITIFIGRSNAGKTRILRQIHGTISSAVNNYVNNLHIYKNFNFKEYLDHYKFEINSSFENKKPSDIKIDMVESPRHNISTFNGLGKKLNKSAESLKYIDPTITDFGTNVVQFNHEFRRNLAEQGSGLQNNVQILDKLHENNNIVIIDEPEISLFPYGKIELLKTIMEESDNKQIIFATHDPTLINQYLIKLMLREKIKIIVYSFCKDHFEKLDFDSNLDPETHVGYLSQTYSTKPVHLIFEGQTEFYLFQAFITKYCVNKKISFFPKYLNKISFSYLGGEQWKHNINHLPDVRFYDVLILLDGEYQKDLMSMVPHVFSFEYFKYEKIKNLLQDSFVEKINFTNLVSKNIEEPFEIFFKEKFQKPLAISQKIWSLNDEEFTKLLNHGNEDIFIMEIICLWALKRAGANVKNLLPNPEIKIRYSQPRLRKNKFLSDAFKWLDNADNDDSENKN